jgi:hypothetical protein
MKFIKVRNGNGEKPALFNAYQRTGSPLVSTDLCKILIVRLGAIDYEICGIKAFNHWFSIN